LTIRAAILDKLGIPETYILAQGSADETALNLLVEAWSWVAASIGEYYPLCVVGLDEMGRQKLEERVTASGLGKSVFVIPWLAFNEITALYQGCSAFFHPSPLAPWGDPVCMALAWGRPVVAIENQFVDARVGPAAYLSSPNAGARGLGAALISTIVEGGLAEALSQQAHRQVSGWQANTLTSSLRQVYTSLLAVAQDTPGK
jgi:glycosyltransferase involved in cell wall biosynthesis